MKPVSEGKKLIVFDVDGTLLDSHRRVLPSTRWSVEQLVAAGHHVALASARPPRSVAHLSNDLLGVETTELVALNGAFITFGTELLHEQALERGAALALLHSARESGLQSNVLSSWDWFVEEMTQQTWEEVAIVEFEPTRVADLTTILTHPVHKFLFIAQPEQVIAFRDWIRASGLPVTAALSKPTYCEVVAHGVSKADAVAFLGRIIGVGRDDTITFGDGENDLPMITAAGIGVAMGNAMANVKRSATLITRSNDEDGIAHALARLGLVSEDWRLGRA